MEERKDNLRYATGCNTGFINYPSDPECQLAGSTGHGAVAVRFIVVMVVHFSQNVCCAAGNQQSDLLRNPLG